MSETKLTNTSQPNSIAQVADVLLAGGVALVPTDTVYGIFVRGKEGRKKLLSVKPRSNDKPISFLVPNGSDLSGVVEISKLGYELIEKHWPGGLTIVFSKVKQPPDEYMVETFGGDDPAFGGNTLGVRCPNHEWLLELLEITGPIAGTSANVSGQKTPLEIKDLDEQIRQSVDIICDGGALSDTASTVVDLTADSLKILRQGFVLVYQSH